MSMCYYIDKKIDFDGTKLSLFDSHMFHGAAKRPNAEYPLLDYNIGDKIEFPVHLIRNTYNIPEMFLPNTNLIISEEIKEYLEPFPGLGFFKVQYLKLFYKEYEEGKSKDIEIEDWMDHFQHDLKLESTLNPYFELIVPRYSVIEDKFDNKKSYSVESDISSFKIELNDELFKKYPIFWHESIFVREDLYRYLESKINKNHFLCISI